MSKDHDDEPMTDRPMTKTTKTLAETLGTKPPAADDPLIEYPLSEDTELPDKVDAKTFCQRIVASPEFRNYLMTGVAAGDLPPAIVAKIMDHAWGKPVERVELKELSDFTEHVPLDVIARRVQLIQDALQHMADRHHVPATSEDDDDTVH